MVHETIPPEFVTLFIMTVVYTLWQLVYLLVEKNWHQFFERRWVKAIYHIISLIIMTTGLGLTFYQASKIIRFAMLDGIVLAVYLKIVQFLILKLRRGRK